MCQSSRQTEMMRNWIFMAILKLKHQQCKYYPLSNYICLKRKFILKTALKLFISSTFAQLFEYHSLENNHTHMHCFSTGRELYEVSWQCTDTSSSKQWCIQTKTLHKNVKPDMKSWGSDTYILSAWFSKRAAFPATGCNQNFFKHISVVTIIKISEFLPNISE